MYGPPQDPPTRGDTTQVVDGVQRVRTWLTVAALVGLGFWRLAYALPHDDWVVAAGAATVIVAAGFMVLADRPSAGGRAPTEAAPVRSAFAMRLTAGVLVLVGLLVGFTG